jgi:hypothetical protein
VSTVADILKEQFCKVTVINTVVEILRELDVPVAVKADTRETAVKATEVVDNIIDLPPQELYSLQLLRSHIPGLAEVAAFQQSSAGRQTTEPAQSRPTLPGQAAGQDAAGDESLQDEPSTDTYSYGMFVGSPQFIANLSRKRPLEDAVIGGVEEEELMGSI